MACVYHYRGGGEPRAVVGLVYGVGGGAGGLLCLLRPYDVGREHVSPGRQGARHVDLGGIRVGTASLLWGGQPSAAGPLDLAADGTTDSQEVFYYIPDLGLSPIEDSSAAGDVEPRGFSSTA